MKSLKDVHSLKTFEMKMKGVRDDVSASNVF